MFRSLFTGLAMASAFLCSLPMAHAAGFSENFATDPAARGWFATGAPGLFAWNASDGALQATWDSRLTNSYFARPLGLTLTRTNDFTLVFDLRLNDFTPGINPAKASASFQLSVGLVRLADATAPGFRRGSGFESPNVCDFSFFPDPGGDWQYGPSLTSAMVDQTGFNWSAGGFAPSGLTTNEVFRVTLAFRAATGVLHTEIMRNGEPWLSLPPAMLTSAFADFALDHVAVCSYNDAGQWPGYEGSLLAHGSLDNLTFLPALPVENLAVRRTAGGCTVSFDSRAGWRYTLERKDVVGWTKVLPTVPGNDDVLTLTDPAPPPLTGLYRVQADLP